MGLQGMLGAGSDGSGACWVGWGEPSLGASQLEWGPCKGPSGRGWASHLLTGLQGGGNSGRGRGGERRRERRSGVDGVGVGVER